MAITYAIRDNGDGTKSVVATDVRTVTEESVLVRTAVEREIANLKIGLKNNQDQIPFIAARIAELEDLLVSQKSLFDAVENTS